MISIFAKQSFLNINPGTPYIHNGNPPKRGYLMRVSSNIRGEQVAQVGNFRLNPESEYKNDTCIYVKPHVGADSDFKFEGRKSYLDIIDGHKLGHLALKHPEVGVITCSKADYDTMKKVLPNEVVFIPQHHCNFERFKRIRNGVTRVGVIGTRDAFPMLPKGLESELNKMGIELYQYSKFFSRDDIIGFYMDIDVQIVWRPYKKILSNPLKLVNAASFGVPTVALDELAFKELEGHYIPVQDLNGLLSYIETFKNYASTYNYYSNLCIKKAEEYHIENVIELYKQLDK